MELDEDFLKSIGVVDATFIGYWKGYRVLEPVFGKGYENQKLGLPILIIEKYGRREVIQDDRCFEIFDTLY